MRKKRYLQGITGSPLEAYSSEAVIPDYSYVCSWNKSGAVLGPQRVCRQMKDEVVAYSTSSREGAEKRPLDLTVEGAFSNPCKWKWALCSSVQFGRIRAILKGVSGNFK